MMAGQLAMIEAFAALPLLLWILECVAQAESAGRRPRLAHLGLALAALSVVLAGHPQLPAYAMGTAVLYCLVRMWGRRALESLGVMALGVGLSGFVWWPMLQLIERNTRVLPLEHPGNDLPFPYWRLNAFFLPWADGWPEPIQRSPPTSFAEPTGAFFWDTVCYVGWIPVFAALLLFGRSILRRRWPARPWLILSVVAVLTLVLALPFAQAITSQFRVTLLRSPSRMLYLTTFALSAAIAVFVEGLLHTLSGRSRVLSAGLVGVLLAAHATDLGKHDLNFIHLIQRLPTMNQEIDRWRRGVGDQRVAFDNELFAPANRAADDLGFFDSIMLARPYRVFLALSGAPAGLNTQNLDGSMLPPSALAGLGAKIVVTSHPREDLKVVNVQEAARSYAVPNPLSRATFLPDACVRFQDDARVLERFREGTIDFKKWMFLDPSARPGDFQLDVTASFAQPVLSYGRPDSDEIVVQVEARSPGYLRVMESWDEGWSATLNGKATDLLVADTFAMAVRLRPGVHEVRLSYRTPGARTGLVLSALSAALLSLLVLGMRSQRRWIT
jgi:hypothetical protein